jgi:hypothetical protein
MGQLNEFLIKVWAPSDKEKLLADGEGLYDMKRDIDGRGSRASARTLIRECLGWNREVTERNLARSSDEKPGRTRHIPRSATRDDPAVGGSVHIKSCAKPFLRPR